MCEEGPPRASIGLWLLSELLGAPPAMGQELAEQTLGPSDSRERLEELREVTSRLKPCGLGARDEREHASEPLGPTLGAGEQPRLASRGHPPEPALSLPVVQLEPPIPERNDELVPLVKHVPNGLPHRLQERQRVELDETLLQVCYDLQAFSLPQLE